MCQVHTFVSWRNRFLSGATVFFFAKVTDGLSELKDVDRASVYEAGKDLAGAAVKVLARGLTLPYREVGAGCRRCLLLLGRRVLLR